MSTTSFAVGEKVVYPNHGVAVIEQISKRTVGNTVESSYLLRFPTSNLKVTVPLQNAVAIGLRRVATNAEALKVLEFLSSGECGSNADWKDRFRENSDKMRTGSLLEIAAVLKGLLILGLPKPISAREKKMLESARFLLITEMAMAREISEEKVKEELNKALTESGLRWPEPENVEA